MSENKQSLPKGYTCACGKYNEFSMYVFAHWDVEITHECDCGRTHVIYQGEAEEM